MSEGSSLKILLSNEAQVTYVTVASEALCHYITDDELDRLGDMHREPVMEIFLAAIGCLAGSIVPSIEAFARFNATANPMGLTGLATLMISVSSLGVAAITGLLSLMKVKQRGRLSERIKSRPRVEVQPSQLS